MARQFFGQDLGAARDARLRPRPALAHDRRRCKRLFAPDAARRASASATCAASCSATLPPEFARWSPLAQDQYLEIRTLLSGYLLSSQGDRMLMAHSVEGRFPFLDREVVALADSLPPTYKLRVLDEKHVLKRVGRRGLVPAEILRARSSRTARRTRCRSSAPERPSGSRRSPSDARRRARRASSTPRPRAALMAKCRARAASGQFSNADNMAVVGILSTQLLYDRFMRRAPDAGPPVAIRTVVDATASLTASRSPA